MLFGMVKSTDDNRKFQRFDSRDPASGWVSVTDKQLNQDRLWLSDLSAPFLRKFHPGKRRLKPSTWFVLQDRTIRSDFGVDVSDTSNLVLWLSMMERVQTYCRSINSPHIIETPYQLLAHQGSRHKSRDIISILMSMPPTFSNYSSLGSDAKSVWLTVSPDALLGSLFRQFIPVGPFTQTAGRTVPTGFSQHSMHQCFIEISQRSYERARQAIQWLPQRFGKTVWVSRPELDLIEAELGAQMPLAAIYSRSSISLKDYLQMELERRDQISPVSIIGLHALLLALLGRGHDYPSLTESYLGALVRLMLMPVAADFAESGIPVYGIGAGRLHVAQVTNELSGRHKLLLPAHLGLSLPEPTSPFEIARDVVQQGDLKECLRLDDLSLKYKEDIPSC